MASGTVAVLHPGEMGGAVGASLAARGVRVVWASQGRSEESRARAASLTDLGALPNVVEASDVVLSICPPHGAVDLARTVAAQGFRGLYVDANAVSPGTTRQIGQIVEAAGATFVDGGIVGPPPGPSASPRLYLSGKGAERVVPLFAGTQVRTIVLDGPVGAASAIKVCYAAWNKGATALIADVLALAAHEGVDAALVAEWGSSQPDAVKRTEGVRTSARKAWRWIAEMEEIAATFAAAGLPDGFHQASTEIYRRLESYKDGATPPALDAITRALRSKPAPPDR
jgi:3-hydroxyisobutyrate dehydrogenase-like beta-hydroxyacid dehydrogenase